MRCPSCHATNPDSATFCGQCYQRFDVVAPSDPLLDTLGGPPPAGEPWTGMANPGPRTPDTTTAEHATADHPTTAHATGQPVAVGRFIADDEGLMWRCALCETRQPIGVFTCTVCGAKMDAEAPDAAANPVDLEAARRLEAVVPGLGHLRTGHSGMGVARSGIVAVWVLGALALATGGPSGLLTAAPLVAGMAVIWATGPGDLGAAHEDRAPRLDARRFMYLVIGVTTGVIVAGGLAVLL